MKQFRIFIENLPETASESEIKSKFCPFGDVTSIEIKERKIVTSKHTSCFFAYVNLKTDETNLQKCFETFINTNWHGQYVKLQIAKESFLERLKRERETNSSKDESPEIYKPEKETKEIVPEPSSYEQEIQPVKRKKKKISSSLQCTVDNKPEIEHLLNNEESTVSNGLENLTETKNPESAFDSIEDIHENETFIQKRRKRGSKIVDGYLKIEQFESSKISNKSDSNEKVLDKRQAESEAKRRKAVQEKIRAYHQQKKGFSVFKTQPKIIRFTDDDYDADTKNSVGKQKESNKYDIFNSDAEEDELEIQKNIESRIKSDERFALDHRFQENDVEDNQNNETIEEEHNMRILDQVLGKTERKDKKSSSHTLIRYDPSNPDHSKFEIHNESKSIQKTKRTNDKAAVMKETPEVSKERVFSKDVDFKSILGNSGGFSLSAMFQSTAKEVEEDDTPNEEIKIPKRSNLNGNPFKFESSDEEDEIEELQEKKPAQPQRPKKVWSEPLFLQDNDFRFQEGLDFVKRIATQKREEGQFEEERRKFKQIVRNKIRNVSKKTNRFKKKLGGSKKKKIKRIEKALAR